MKLIIAGSRTITDYSLLKTALDNNGLPITTIISGGARGVDQLGERYAKENGIDLIIMPANWDLHGRSAGYKRNVAMAQIADGLLAFWDGQSKGTKHMIDIATSKNLPVIVIKA